MTLFEAHEFNSPKALAKDPESAGSLTRSTTSNPNS